MTKSEIARKVVEQIRANKHLEGYNSTVMQGLGDYEVFSILDLHSRMMLHPSDIAKVVKAHEHNRGYMFSKQTIDGITGDHINLVFGEALEILMDFHHVDLDDADKMLGDL